MAHASVGLSVHSINIVLSVPFSTCWPVKPERLYHLNVLYQSDHLSHVRSSTCADGHLRHSKDTCVSARMAHAPQRFSTFSSCIPFIQACIGSHGLPRGGTKALSISYSVSIISLTFRIQRFSFPTWQWRGSTLCFHGIGIQCFNSSAVIVSHTASKHALICLVSYLLARNISTHLSMPLIGTHCWIWTTLLHPNMAIFLIDSEEWVEVLCGWEACRPWRDCRFPEQWLTARRVFSCLLNVLLSLDYPLHSLNCQMNIM